MKAERGGEVSLLSLSLLLLISSLPPLKPLVLRLGTPSPISLDLTLVPIHFGEYKIIKSVVNNYVKAAATEA